MDLECCSYYLQLPLLTCCLFLLYSIFNVFAAARSCGSGDDQLAPRSYPVVGCLVDFYRNRRRLLGWYTALLAASPSQTIVVDRLGARRTVVTANPANVEHVLKGNFGNYPKGKPFTEVLGDLLGGGIFNVDGEMWYRQRKMVSHEFSARVLRETDSGRGDVVGVDLEGSRGARVLHAALCETMRLYPPVAWDSKHAAEDDVLPDGTRVGRGDRVTYFPYGMGRMESIWGPDAGEFRPRRWLALPRDGVSPFKYPVFQGGPRTCLGKEMAFVQMKFVASAVLRRFERRPVAEGSPVFVPLLTAHMAGGLKVTVTRRRHRQQNGTCER
uniref:Cytochrome P450 n=1 Tax=Oryza brachyantha TaxID=4533 RepID=J3ND74_ORYBR